MPLEEKVPGLLSDPGLLLIPKPPPPPNTTTINHEDSGPQSTCHHHDWEQMEAAATGQDSCHGVHSPLEFWELLFVSSKWFCALLSTLRLKALSAGWGTGEREQEKMMAMGQH